MQSKEQKQLGALRRRRRDVETYKTMLDTKQFPEDLTEEIVKRKLNIAREHVHTLEGRLENYLKVEEEQA